MSDIRTFTFSEQGIEPIRTYRYGHDWPVVYLLENGKDMYVGESVRAYHRGKEHLKTPEKSGLRTMHVIADNEFNMSATKDTESWLIEYLVADNQYNLLNGNAGLQNHSYFDREKYKSKFEVIWKKLQAMRLAKNDLLQIRNSEIFKYSPYKTLTDDQYHVTNEILESLASSDPSIHIVHGGPGTGKSIVATFLIKQLVEKGTTNVALVVAMTALRNTLKKVFRGVPGLKPSMVIGPAEAATGNFDVLIVDEAHRLRQRKNIPNYGTFDATNRSLDLPPTADELDWILKGSKHSVLFYDAGQHVRPSDINPGRIQSLATQTYQLKTQMRVKGGEDYLTFIDNLLEGKITALPKFKDYELRIFDDLEDMVSKIKEHDSKVGLSRILAGYAWEWVSRTTPSKPDIAIGNSRLFWNSQLTDWVNSKNAINEVGCIHTIQGYDLNYAGVIIGPELSFNKEAQTLVVKREHYFDANGHRGVTDPNELRRYIINIYKTLMTRGILGTYLYVCDENLRDYLKQAITTDPSDRSERKEGMADLPTKSPYAGQLISLPLYDSIGCGDLMYADPVAHESYDVPKELVRPGAKYFVLRTAGDSMNKRGINDGDLILCQKNYQAASGSIAVVLVGEEATLKEIQYQADGLLLKPHSSNPRHHSYKLVEGDEFKVLGVFVAKL